MWFLVFFLLANFIGLTAFFAALVLWRRESGYSLGWLVSRRGLGTLCVLAAGAGLVVGAQLKLVNWFHVWFPLPSYAEDLDFLSLRAVAFLVACLVLLAIGAALLVLGGPVGGSRSTHEKGPFAWSAAVALIITLTEMSIFLYYQFELKTVKLYEGVTIKALPTLELDTKGTRPNETYKKDYQFSSGTEFFFSRHIPFWEKALEDYKGKPNVHYLEVGIYEGRSSLWMLENVLTHPTARLTGIDPFSDPAYLRSSKPYKEIFYSNLKASGSEGKTRIIEGYSQVELRKLPLESFDIIYIDGSHKSEDVLEDAILSWRLLKDGGIIIFDDYLLHEGTKWGIDTFFAFFDEHFELVHVGRQVILRKKPLEGSSPGPPRQQ